MKETLIEALKTTIEFFGYVAKFFSLLAISWGISIIIPLTCFEVSILMMVFWFLNLYHVK